MEDDDIPSFVNEELRDEIIAIRSMYSLGSSTESDSEKKEGKTCEKIVNYTFDDSCKTVRLEMTVRIDDEFYDEENEEKEEEEESDHENAQVILCFEFGSSYPTDPPKVELKKEEGSVVGLSEKQQKSLNNYLRKTMKKQLRGEVVVYELTQKCKEYLEENQFSEDLRSLAEKQKLRLEQEQKEKELKRIIELQKAEQLENERRMKKMQKRLNRSKKKHNMSTDGLVNSVIDIESESDDDDDDDDNSGDSVEDETNMKNKNNYFSSYQSIETESDGGDEGNEDFIEEEEEDEEDDEGEFVEEEEEESDEEYMSPGMMSLNTFSPGIDSLLGGETENLQIIIYKLMKSLLEQQNKFDQKKFKQLLNRMNSAKILNMPVPKNLKDLDSQYEKIFNDKINQGVLTKNPLFQYIFETNNKKNITQNQEIDRSGINSRYINDFMELDYVGGGAFGTVVSARNKLDQRIYAIKKIIFSKSDKREERIMLREVKLLSRLIHQNIVRYYNCWVEDLNEKNKKILLNEELLMKRLDDSELSDSYASSSDKFEMDKLMLIQMEHCSGTLKEMMVNQTLYQGNFRENLWQYLRQIIEGLHFLHKNNVIHRDLKPENIFWNYLKQGIVQMKLGDFGLARFGGAQKFFHKSASETDVSGIIENEKKNNGKNLTKKIGTPTYTAPEISDSKTISYDTSSDIYSLGIIFFEMCMNFDSLHERGRFIKELRSTGKIGHYFPKEWKKEKKLIEKMVSHNPSDRPSCKKILESGILPLKIEKEVVNRLFSRDMEIDMHQWPLKFEIGEDLKNYYDESVVNTLIFHAQIHCACSSVLNDCGKKKHTRSRTTGGLDFDHDHDFVSGGFSSTIDEAKICKNFGKNFIPASEQSMSNDFISGNSTYLFNKFIMEDGKMMKFCDKDLVIPLARLLNRRKIMGKIKKYSIGNIVRSKYDEVYEKEVFGFDYICQDKKNSYLQQSEVIKFCVGLKNYFYLSNSKWMVIFNHPMFFDELIKKIGLEKKEKIISFSKFLLKMKKNGFSFDGKNGMKNVLKNELKLSIDKVNLISSFSEKFRSVNYEGSEVIKILKEILVITVEVRECLRQIISFLKYLEIWKIPSESVGLQFDPFLPCDKFHDFYFEFGIMKGNKFSKLAHGGRYDKIVHSFSPVKNISRGELSQLRYSHLLGNKYYNNDICCVNATINVRKIQKKCDLRDSTINPYLNGAPNVVVYKKRIKMRMQILDLLWERKIKADLILESEKSLNEVIDYCWKFQIRWIVIPHSSGRNDDVDFLDRSVKVIEVIRRKKSKGKMKKKKTKPSVLQMSELVEFILSYGRGYSEKERERKEK